ncbi:MAG: hypothetical protein GC190_04005 [Alphaproteobacteria bacterium]|nr:hypothetical protein [Alphaproteobacteria bacterium]
MLEPLFFEFVFANERRDVEPNARDDARVLQTRNGVISHVRLARAQSRTLLRQHRLFVVKKLNRF